MAAELKMPKMGLTMSTADVAKWLKKEGDPVKKGEPVVEVMTDKLSNQVESPADGIILKIVSPEGSQLEAGGLLAYIGNAGEAIPTLAETSQAAPDAPAEQVAVQESTKADPALPTRRGLIKASPAAKALARANKRDISTIKGTGPGGRIVKADVELALKSPCVEPCQNTPTLQVNEDEVLRTIPYSGMREVIGRNMHKSWSSVPHVTLHTEVAVDNLIKLRQTINADCEPMDRVSITDLMVKLISTAIKSHPEINSLFDGQKTNVMKHVNFGIAVAINGGLVVPVIKKADTKSLRTISTELKDLAFRAKNGTLGIDDMSGGTLTVSNLGGFGSVDTFNPIINTPEVAIIGLGRSRKVPIVVDDDVKIGTVMSISVTHDHRVLDGAPVAAFMATLNKLIGNPMLGVF